MFLAAFPTGAFEANCYVVATGEGAECVVVDPGQDAFDTIAEICAENRLTPVAVCATHGHLDHIADAAQVCEQWQVPCWIHPADRPLLSEPMRGLPAQWRTAVQELIGGTSLPEPERVEAYGDGLEVAGLRFTVRHAPGHSPGSVLLELPFDTDPDSDTSATATASSAGAGGDAHQLVFSGDVVFAGSIGRTDLPGGDEAVMADTLAGLVADVPAGAVLLPGHGPRTTMGQERVSNPYLPRAAAD